MDVKKEIEDDSADIYFPIEGGKFDDKYRWVWPLHSSLRLPSFLLFHELFNQNNCVLNFTNLLIANSLINLKLVF